MSIIESPGCFGRAMRERSDQFEMQILTRKLIAAEKERNEWKDNAESNELDASFWKERAQTNKRDAARYLSEIEMSAKRMFERMYGGLPLGKNGKRFVQQEYDSLCAVLKAAREANP